MSILEENVKLVIQKINVLHDTLNLSNWGNLKRDGFVFELEKSTVKLKEIFELMKQVNKETIMLLEKNTPDINQFLEKIEKDIIVFESNIKMEKTKKMRIELINENEQVDVPELYRTLQNKILEISLRARYEIEKINRFIIARKTPFIKKGSTAKALIEILQKREEELDEIKKKNVELKRKSFFKAEEVSIVEIEEDLHEKDKALEESVKETRKALETHLAQIKYVEGSFSHLEKRIIQIETIHTNFTKKAIQLIRELKKERDYARKTAIEIEEETLKARQNYSKEIIDLNEQKSELKEKLEEKYLREINNLKKDINDKHVGLENMQKLIEIQEKQIKKLKEKIQTNFEIKKAQNELTNQNNYN